MAVPHSTQHAEELRHEQAVLIKAETDIEHGWERLRGQQDLVNQLQNAGRDTEQAERLVQLMKQTLVEWERHRRLIEQRIAYLKNEAATS